MTENTIVRIKTDGSTSEEFKFKPGDAVIFDSNKLMT